MSFSIHSVQNIPKSKGGENTNVGQDHIIWIDVGYNNYGYCTWYYHLHVPVRRLQ